MVAGCGERDSVRRPDVLLISIDTLRADHLGAYGHDRDTTPAIDALAESGVVFERCFATAPNTAPSHMSIMTSLYPTAHAVPNGTTSTEEPTALVLPAATTTLAEVLGGAGYQTVGFADGGNVGRAHGFGRGFDRYRSFYDGVTSKVDQTIAWLRRQRDAERPWFVFLHTYEVHAPYLPPDDLARRFVSEYDGWLRPYCYDEQGRIKDADLSGFHRIFDEAQRLDEDDVRFLRELYDAEIAHTDRELRRLFRFLRDEELDQDLLIVLVSDHGEEFGEHGAYGHKQMFDEVTRVPLVLAGTPLPAGRPRVDELVSLLDVMPTILELAGLAAPPHVQGTSLVPLLTGSSAAPRTVFAELIGHAPGPILSMMRDDREKLIHYRSPRADQETDRTPALRLFDLTTDPSESANLAVDERDRARALRKRLDPWLAENERLRQRFGARKTKAGPDVLQELKQLGY